MTRFYERIMNSVPHVHKSSDWQPMLQLLRPLKLHLHLHLHLKPGRNVLTLPWAQGALNRGYSPDPPLFLSREVAYVTLRGAFRRMLRHRIRNKGEGGGGLVVRGGGGAWAWKPLPGKPLSPIPEPIGAGDWTHAKVFLGPRGALMRSSHWELLFLHWEEKGWPKLQRSGRVGVHPPSGFHFRGVYDPGQDASYEGAVEGLTIIRPIKPLGRAAPATSSTTGPTGAPQGAPPSAAANVRTALGAMGTIGPEPDFEVCAFIIPS